MTERVIQLCIILLFGVSISSYGSVRGSISGYYADNGYKTEMYRDLSVDDAQEIEQDILELLGLPDRPRKKHGHPSLRKSAPKFLLDVYKRLNDESNDRASRVTRSIDDDENEHFITDTDNDAIHESDIIMTFLNKKNHVAEVRHEHGRKLWFDVSEVSPDSMLMMAELRIFQNPSLGRWKELQKEFNISVYVVTKSDNQQELELLSSTNTTSDYHGWLELNVTDAISRWMTHPRDNKGLYIGAQAVNRPEREIKLDDIGLVNAKGDDEYQPFMIGYFKSQNMLKTVQHSNRIKRNVPRRRPKSSRRNPYVEHRYTGHPKNCQIQTLYVSFKDLKWQDWIIAPDGYGAFYCSGECNFPLNAHMNATNHAIVQTLAHLMQPSKVPKACCAPTKLSPISVLYFLDETNVNLKKYRNMVVRSCGCH